jgi:hypothetical protein
MFIRMVASTLTRRVGRSGFPIQKFMFEEYCFLSVTESAIRICSTREAWGLLQLKGDTNIGVLRRWLLFIGRWNISQRLWLCVLRGSEGFYLSNRPINSDNYPVAGQTSQRAVLPTEMKKLDACPVIALRWSYFRCPFDVVLLIALLDYPPLPYSGGSSVSVSWTFTIDPLAELEGNVC